MTVLETIPDPFANIMGGFRGTGQSPEEPAPQDAAPRAPAPQTPSFSGTALQYLKNLFGSFDALNVPGLHFLPIPEKEELLMEVFAHGCMRSGRNVMLLTRKHKIEASWNQGYKGSGSIKRYYEPFSPKDLKTILADKSVDIVFADGMRLLGGPGKGPFEPSELKKLHSAALTQNIPLYLIKSTEFNIDTSSFISNMKGSHQLACHVSIGRTTTDIRTVLTNSAKPGLTAKGTFGFSYNEETGHLATRRG